MDKIIIQGGRALKGKVRVSGSKNAALPIMAAGILTRGWNTFANIPDLADIRTLSKLLRGFGMDVQEKRHAVKIRADKIRKGEAPYDLVRTMRASIARMKRTLEMSVVEGIRESLTPFSSELSSPLRPGVKVLANVEHLFTPISATLNAGVRPPGWDEAPGPPPAAARRRSRSR